MPKRRSALETATGKLISAIQREWLTETGTQQAEVSEHAMNQAHGLLQAAKTGSLQSALGTSSVTSYLGALWVKQHPSVLPAIERLELAAKAAHA